MLNYIIFIHDGAILGGGLKVNRKTHIHMGEKALEYCLNVLIKYSNKNSVVFIDSIINYKYILEYFKKEEVRVVDLNENYYSFSCICSNKKIQFRLITKFINSWEFSIDDKLELKQTIINQLTQFEIVLSELDYNLKKYNERWYICKSLPQVIPFILKTILNPDNLYTTSELYDQLKDNYWGGRVYLKKPGVYNNVVCIDFKSMYTKTLLEDFPQNKPQHMENINNIDLPGFYEVVVESDNAVYTLPSKLNSRTDFMVGVFSGIYWWEELVWFSNNGGKIIKINNAWVYKNTANSFKAFAEECLTMREKNQICKKLYKQIPNMCLGWLGQVLTTDVYKRRNIAYPIISASKARIKWYSYFKKIIEAGGDVIYGDTDSFFVENLPKDFIIDTKIFSVKKYKTFVLKGKRCYGVVTVDDCIELKGFKSLESFHNFKQNIK